MVEAKDVFKLYDWATCITRDKYQGDGACIRVWEKKPYMCDEAHAWFRDEEGKHHEIYGVELVEFKDKSWDKCITYRNQTYDKCIGKLGYFYNDSDVDLGTYSKNANRYYIDVLDNYNPTDETPYVSKGLYPYGKENIPACHWKYFKPIYDKNLVVKREVRHQK